MNKYFVILFIGCADITSFYQVAGLDSVNLDFIL